MKTHALSLLGTTRLLSRSDRIELLINIIEDSQKANEAEMGVIEELRQMGGEVLHCWSEHKIAQTTEDFNYALAHQFRQNRKCAPIYYSATLKTTRCMVDTR